MKIPQIILDFNRPSPYVSARVNGKGHVIVTCQDGSKEHWQKKSGRWAPKDDSSAAVQAGDR